MAKKSNQRQVAKFLREVDACDRRWSARLAAPIIATKKLLIGRKIVGFSLGAFPNGRGGKAYNPIITLDNGARLMFDVTETEFSIYGVTPDYYPKKGA